jgi:HipA-like protein
VSLKDSIDYIYLAWQEPSTGRYYIVGQLAQKNKGYEFSYGYEVEKALQRGFKLLIPFADLHKVYRSDTLFPTFSSRLPDKKRRGIEKILAKYGLKEYDAFNLLKRSGARLPIDNLWFIDPVLSRPKTKSVRRPYSAQKTWGLKS